jgi:hypothetical protein
MRSYFIIALAALSLTACGKNDQAANTTNGDESMSAESITSNDVTAIDAVTGEASNMAADVNYTEELNALNAVGNEAKPSMSTPRRPTPEKPEPEQPAPTQPVANNAI